MEEIYYVDRPSVPAERQNIVHIDSILEHSMIIDSVAINPTYLGHAVEVRNSSGAIAGTLVYFDSVTHAQLTTPPAVEDGTVETDEEVADEDEMFVVSRRCRSKSGAEAEETGDVVDDGVLSDTPAAVAQFNKESRLIDLELALAEANHTVQEITDQIADIEKEAFID